MVHAAQMRTAAKDFATGPGIGVAEPESASSHPGRAAAVTLTTLTGLQPAATVTDDVESRSNKQTNKAARKDLPMSSTIAGLLRPASSVRSLHTHVSAGLAARVPVGAAVTSGESDMSTARRRADTHSSAMSSQQQLLPRDVDVSGVEDGGVFDDDADGSSVSTSSSARRARSRSPGRPRALLSAQFGDACVQKSFSVAAAAVDPSDSTTHVTAAAIGGGDHETHNRMVHVHDSLAPSPAVVTVVGNKKFVFRTQTAAVLESQGLAIGLPSRAEPRSLSGTVRKQRPMSAAAPRFAAPRAGAGGPGTGAPHFFGKTITVSAPGRPQSAVVLRPGVAPAGRAVNVTVPLQHGTNASSRRSAGLKRLPHGDGDAAAAAEHAGTAAVVAAPGPLQQRPHKSWKQLMHCVKDERKRSASTTTDRGLTAESFRYLFQGTVKDDAIHLDSSLPHDDARVSTATLQTASPSRDGHSSGSLPAAAIALPLGAAAARASNSQLWAFKHVHGAQVGWADPQW
jgi:hypothetical protein